MHKFSRTFYALIGLFVALAFTMGIVFASPMRQGETDFTAIDEYIITQINDLSIPVWQGDQDVMVPLPMGWCFAKTLPKCQATFCAGEGHMLIFPVDLGNLYRGVGCCL